MANKDINDLELGFLYPIVEVREKHLFGYDRALIPAEQLEHAIFLAGQTDHSVINRHDAGIQVHHQLVCSDRRSGCLLVCVVENCKHVHRCPAEFTQPQQIAGSITLIHINQLAQLDLERTRPLSAARA